ncbi:MAG: 4Fe-4S binding protein [Thermodesulfobacteriota bacterium]|nr:4Fe-4S binding protein [Thermodesulfobacteriota bacterium]
MIICKTKLQRISILIAVILLSLNSISQAAVDLITKKSLGNVLPDAGLFVKKLEPFTHYLGYRDEGGQLVGAAFLTTDVVPDQSWGYSSQIATLIGVDVNGMITGVTVLSEFESPRYTKGLLSDQSWFLTQFYGKDVNDDFIINYDVDAISGATITSTTINRSIKTGLQLVTQEVLNKQVDSSKSVKAIIFQQVLWQIDFLFLWIMVGLAFLSFFKKNEVLRYFTLGMSFGYLGIFMGGGFSLVDVLRVLSFHNPEFLNNLYWYSLLFFALGLSVAAGRFYCGWLCPFGAFIEILFRLVPGKWTIPENIDRFFKLLKYVILLILLIIGFVFKNQNLAIYLTGIIEPFGTFFHLDGDLTAWLFLLVFLFFSIFISRFFCRYFCPLGAFFAVIAGISSFLGLRQINVSLPQADNGKNKCQGCKSAQRQCKMGAISYDEDLKQPDIDKNECFMCNTCAVHCPVLSKKDRQIQKRPANSIKEQNNGLY